MLNFETGRLFFVCLNADVIQIYEKSRSQIFLLKFEFGSLFFVRLNAGSQILKICRSQIYEKSRSQIFMLKFLINYTYMIN